VSGERGGAALATAEGAAAPSMKVPLDGGAWPCGGEPFACDGVRDWELEVKRSELN
jgi:hypothetical protein